MIDKKLVIATGASGGIGRNIAKKFYMNGYFVVMVDINEENIHAAAKDVEIPADCYKAVVLDVSSEEKVKAFMDATVAEFGRIDALVNAAGICGKYNETIDYTFDNFKRIYEINVFGTFLMMKYALPQMVEQKKGAIVNFGSVSGMTGYTYEIGYGSSKWAVIGMTKNVANEYANRGIRANSISPGWVQTNMFKQSLDDYADLMGGEPSFTMAPIGRVADPMEMANVVYWLCTDEASYVTSANVLVDGGMMLG